MEKSIYTDSLADDRADFIDNLFIKYYNLLNSEEKCGKICC